MATSLDIGALPTTTAALGRLVRGSSGRTNTRARVDTEGATGQTSVINITGATNSETYSARFKSRQLDQTVTVTTDGSATQTELRDALKTAIEADSLLMGFINTITAGSNILTIVWKLSALPVTVTYPLNPNTDLTLTNTAAAAGPSYLYGRAVEVRANTAEGALVTEGIRRATEVAGVILGLSQTHNVSDVYEVTLIVDGVAVLIAWSAGGSAGATDTAAKAAVDAAALPTGTTCVIDGTGELTITFPNGHAVSIADADVTGTGPVAIVQDSAAAATPRFCLVVDEGTTAAPEPRGNFQSAATGPIPGSTVLTADQSGSHVWAVEAPTSTPSLDGDVFVECDATADRGRLFTVGSLTRIKWPEAKWVGLDPQDSTIAHIRL